MFVPLFSCEDILSPNSPIPHDININLIRPYLRSVPGFTLINNKPFQQKYIEHHKSIQDQLKTVEGDLTSFIQKTKEEDSKDQGSHEISLTESHPDIFNQLLRRNVYGYLYRKYRKKMHSIYLDIANQQLEIHHHLVLLCNWLIENPHPIIINASRAFPQKESVAFSKYPNLYRRYRSLKLAYSEQQHFIMHIPNFFRMSDQNHIFLASAIESAITARKKEFTYFEPLQIEDSLFEFFRAQGSPLVQNQLYPIVLALPPQENLTDEEYLEVKTKVAIDWINRATQVLAEFDGNLEIEERSQSIGIYLTRFLFDSTYPLLDLPMKDSPENKHLGKLIDIISQKTPLDLQIPVKYLPKELVDKKISALFEQNSIAKAPVEWLQLAQYRVCPIDAGYCIFKAHESLSILATLQATLNGIESGKDKEVDSESFFSKVPGFDDIFGLWICLFCTAQLADPRTLNTSIVNWSKLPGFSQRFLACCAYLEAAISQSEQEGQI